LIRPEAFVQLASPSIDALLLTLRRIFLHLLHAKYPGRVSQPADWIRRALPAREAARSDDLDGAALPDFAGVQPCSRGRQFLDERSYAGHDDRAIDHDRRFDEVGSGGGLTSVDTARKFPVRLVESGPAGGAVFAAQIAARLGERKVLAFDMGGTTAKVSLIEDFRSETSRVFEVDRADRFLKGSGLPVRIPVIEIGAGGGSQSRLDALKRVTVGPESASSVPGPVCYNGGGSDPAVTDADVALGLIDPTTFAGGTIKLYPDLAKKALKKVIGDPLGLDEEMAAYTVYEMVCENMASAARVHTVEHGAVASNHTVIAFGGAGAAACGAGGGEASSPRPMRVSAPRSASWRRRFPTRWSRPSICGSTASTRRRPNCSAAWPAIFAPGLSRPRRVSRWSSAASRSLRYVGLGHEIGVELPVRDLLATDTAALHTQYAADYEKLFRRSSGRGDRNHGLVRQCLDRLAAARADCRR
jgi:N-methylhydantoinase A